MPLSFCFFTTAAATFDSTSACWAAVNCSGVAWPEGASSLRVR
jgi:hypothetical protein